MDCGEIIQRGCAELGILLENRQTIDRLVTYYSELVKWNRRMNLVAHASEQEIVESHFLDSLTLLPYLETGDKFELLDVGTGAGFPGLVLKTVRPSLALTLVEPRTKRVTFLRHIVRTLRLDGVDIVERRLEPVLQGVMRSYSCVTSRALAAIGDFLELSVPFCSRGGMVICMKGPKAEEEISQWQINWPESPYRLEKIVPLILPFSRAERNLVLFRKSGD